MFSSLEGGFIDIKNKMKRRIVNGGINAQIVDLIKGAFEKAYAAQNVVLSELERERLREIVAKEILTDLLDGIDGQGNS